MTRLPHRAALALLAITALSSLACAAAARTAAKPAAPPAPAAAAAPVDPKRELFARDDERVAAMVAADASKLAGFLSDHLTYIHSSRVIEGKPSVIDEIATGKIRYKGIDFTDRDARFYGDTAVVDGFAALRAESGGQAFAFSVAFTEVWVKADGVWQLAAWQATRVARP